MIKSVYDYAIPVHRSLLKRDLIAGVSRLSLMLIIAFIYIGSVELRLPLIFAPGGLVLFFIIRSLTSKDEYLVEIVANSLLSPDILYP